MRKEKLPDNFARLIDGLSELIHEFCGCITMNKGLFIAFLFVAKSTLAQDGSDMRYIEEKHINSDILGKFVHIDFYRSSFGGRTIDTVSISFDKFDKFREVREDD